VPAILVLALTVGGVYSGRDNQLHVQVPRVDAPAIAVGGALDEPEWR